MRQTLIAASIAAVALLGAPALAGTPDDRTVDAEQPAEVVVRDIAIAALAMCNEAKAAGEIRSVPRCVVTVVTATVDATGDPALIAYVRDNQVKLRRIAIGE